MLPSRLLKCSLTCLSATGQSPSVVVVVGCWMDQAVRVVERGWCHGGLVALW